MNIILVNCFRDARLTLMLAKQRSDKTSAFDSDLWEYRAAEKELGAAKRAYRDAREALLLSIPM